MPIGTVTTTGKADLESHPPQHLIGSRKWIRDGTWQGQYYNLGSKLNEKNKIQTFFRAKVFYLRCSTSLTKVENNKLTFFQCCKTAHFYFIYFLVKKVMS
jgi:hypothetical protein